MINQVLNSFPPITLEEMSAVKLMNRIDTKFVATLPKLIELLHLLGNDYYVQDINGERLMPYDTTYFDTKAFNMYNAHQANHANRQKLRFRTYVHSELQYMEVKTKNNHGRTKKKRIEVQDMRLNEEYKADFLQQHLHYEIDTLIPTIRNQFKRVTLVNKAKTERLTIDTDLRFDNLVTGCQLEIGRAHV